MDAKLKRDEIRVNGQRVGYALYALDARPEDQRVDNASQGSIDGNTIVFIPGHGQRATSARHLLAALIEASRSKLLLSIDVDPPPGGDPMKAEALIAIIKQWAISRQPADVTAGMTPPQSFKVTLVGWSHGGADALRAAEKAPGLIEHVAILCPAGLEQRALPELLLSFIGEIFRIGVDCIRRGRFAMAAAIRMGFDLVMGLAGDLLHTRSLARLIQDVRWGARKVVGSNYAYNGDVLILFGIQDSVIRWQGAIPDCHAVAELPSYLESYRSQNFPKARSLRVQILEGNHLAPEILAPLYVQAIFDAQG